MKTSSVYRIVLILILLLSFSRGADSQQIYGQVDALRGSAGADVEGKPNNRGVPAINVSLLKPFPVSLSYDASGIKPDQLPSAVGLGWSLNAGGEITRVVHGLRDEINNMRPQGMSAAQNQAWLTVGTQSESTVPISQMLSGINNFKLDTAPDEFRYNIIGRSGVFIFKADGSIIADRRIRVRVSTFPGGAVYSHDHFNNSDDYATISGIVITFEDGVVCSFKQMQTQKHIFASTPSTRPYYDDAQTLNTWKITKIIYPNTIVPVVFEYIAGLIEHEQYSSEDVMVESNGHFMLTAMSGRIKNNKCYISRITGGDFDIRFIYSSSSSAPGFNYLAAINSFAVNGSYLDSFHFSYNWISPTKFLLEMIEGINPIANPPTKSGRYHFEYNTSTLIPEFSYFPYQDFYALKALGYTYNHIADVPAPQNNTAGVDYWGFYNGVKPAYRTLVAEFTSATHTFSGRPFNQHLIGGLSRADRDPNPAATQALILNKIIYPTGGYIKYEYENNDYSYVPGTGYESSKVISGGLRIKRLTRSDGINTPYVVKEFQYLSADNANLSSGVLEHEPIYHEYFSRGQNLPQCNLTSSLIVYTPFSILPIDVSYSRIKEINNDGSYSTYDYTTPKEYNGYGHTRPYFMFGCPDTYGGSDFARGTHNFINVPHQDRVMRGLLVKQEDFSASGKTIKRVIFNYTRYDVGGILAFEQYFIPTKPDYVNYVDGNAYYIDCYCNRGNSLAPGYPDDYYNYIDWYFARVYTRTIALPVLVTKIERNYDQNSATNYREAEAAYTFNSSNFKYSSVSKRDNSALTTQDGGGVTSREEYYYPTDYNLGVAIANRLKQDNRLSEVLEHRTYRNGRLIGAELNEFSLFSANAEKKYKLELDSPPEFLNNFVFNPNNFWENAQAYKLQGQIIYNQDTKKVESIKARGAGAVHTLFGYNGTLPIATISGPSLEYNRSVRSGSGIASYTGNMSNTVLLNLTIDRPLEVLLEICLSTPNSYVEPISIYLQDINTGQRLFSHVFTSREEGACSSGSGLGRTLPFVVSVSPGQYQVLGYYKFGYGSTTVSITANTVETMKNAFYTSFEDYSLPMIRNGGKTGEKCLEGIFNLQLPSKQGDYVVSYWQSPNFGNQAWTYSESIVNINAANSSTSIPLGSNTSYLDEVRMYPLGSTISTKTYKQGRGANYMMDTNGMLQVTEYDEFGRIKLVKDTNLDIVNYNQYRVGAP